MKRKYDKRNKRNFILIIILSILIIGIFSLFIYKYLSAAKVMYQLDAGTIVQDDLKNYVELSDDAKLKIRWNGNYYLDYNDNKIDFGKNVITYNPITGVMKLYGPFYEIQDDGKLVSLSDETILPNTTDAKFYKISDRKYLLVDTKIFSDDRKIEADNYLLVELDKLGNAKLSNNKLNLKTISETTLVTSEYSFDINNEMLYYSMDGINLKKIIGSTNEYTPKDVEEEKEEKKDKQNGNTAGNNNVVDTGIGTGKTTGVVNNSDIGNVTDINELIDKLKMTSVIRIVEGLTQIDVDYVIYDPYSEYKSVYVEVIGLGNVDTIYLNKNETHVTIGSLAANTKYKLNFIYTTVDTETNEIAPFTFDSYELKTGMPEYSVSIYKISTVSNILTYKVNLQEGFNTSAVNTVISFDYDEIDLETGDVVSKTAKIKDRISITGNPKSVLGNVSIDGYNIDRDTVLKLSITSIETSGGTMPINESYSFRFGR